MRSGEGLYNGFLSHVYVERRVSDHPVTRDILSRLKKSEVILIDHYKDIFSRSRQSYMEQLKARSLILASREGRAVFEGAPVCQSFGNRDFYYVSSAMNCPFNCEYCYLKGMYPSGNIVIFVNQEDHEKELLELAKDRKVYACVSYDTDLIGLDYISGQASSWMDFAEKNPSILIEMRTKAAPASLRPLENMIYAFTLSPEGIAKRYEPGAPPLKARLASAAAALEAGCRVRLCFDPMIYLPDYKEQYGKLIEETAGKTGFDRIEDVSVGTFRISEEYLKRMRKAMPDSDIAWFPYDPDEGYFTYSPERNREMMDYMTGLLSRYIDEGRIWTWK